MPWFRLRRGFSLLEVAVASLLFLVVATGLTATVAVSTAAQAESSLRSQIDSTLGSMLREVASQGFDRIAADTFDPPEACPGDQGRGARGRSCFSVGGLDLQADWSVSFGEDLAGTSLSAYPDAVVSVAVSLPSGEQLSRSLRVVAPTPGFDGQGVVRVRVGGPFDLLTGPVYLLRRSDTSQVVAAAEVSASGTAIFRADPASCAQADPCVLGLSSGDRWMTDGVLALSPASALGPGSDVVLEAGKVTQASIEVFEPGEATLLLSAVGDEGQQAPNRVPGSVCLWAEFSDGVTTREVPVCNLPDADRIPLSGYVPDPSKPSQVFPIPVGAEVRLRTDRSDGACPQVDGMVAPVGSQWTQAAVCTSWTWGDPARLEKPGVSVDWLGPDPPTVTLAPATSDTYTVVWSGRFSRPAAGYGSQPLWENPREKPPCADDASCASVSGTVPEDDLCPGQHCLAARVPHVTAPVAGGMLSAQLGQAPYSFDLEVADYGGDPVTVTVVSVPSSGVLSYDGAPVTPGQVLGTTPAGGGAFTLVFDDSAAPVSLDWFTVRLENTLPNGAADYDVALWRVRSGWELDAKGVSVPQGGTAEVVVSVLGPDGSKPVGDQLSFTASDPGLTVSSPVTVSGDGAASALLTADSALQAGSYTVTATSSSGRSVTVPVTVAQKAGGLSVSAPAQAGQGSVYPVSVSAVDLAGAPMGGVRVSFRVLDQSGLTAFGVYTTPGGCVTDPSGSCSVMLRAETPAPAGSYLVTAASGSFTAQAAVQVQSVVSRIFAPESVSVTQGGSTSLTVTVTDGAGVPMPNVQVSASPPTGVSVSPSQQATDASGSASFTVSASTTAESGPSILGFSAGSASASVGLTVEPLPAAAALAAPVSVPQGKARQGVVRVSDPNGDPAPGARVVFDPPPPGIQVSQATSADDGSAVFDVSASPSVPKGSYTLSATVTRPDGQAIGSLQVPVTVTQGAVGVSLSGWAVSGGSGTIAVHVADGEGDPVPGAEVRLGMLPQTMTAPSPAVTDASGSAYIQVSDTGAAARGWYLVELTVTFDGDVSTVRAMMEVR